MDASRRHWIRDAIFAATVVLLTASALPHAAVAQERLTVFAAASLKNALDNLNKSWTGEVAVSYASSSALAKQIEMGAPADLFISADLDWMAYLSERKLLKDDTAANLLGNRLVLVSAEADAPTVEIKPGFGLARLLGGGRLAMGEPNSVPAGKYGKAALENLGVWPSVERSVAGAESVRAALALVSRGEAPYGIVYQTDAAAEPGVKVVGVFPSDTHPPIIYPVAVLARSRSPAATAYLEFLTSPEAVPYFEKEGFTVLK